MTTEIDMWLLGAEGSLLQEYDKAVIQGPTWDEYSRIIQWGKKEGESLFMHVLNGVLVLETLHKQLRLEELERRILYTAFTIHDLNKTRQEQIGFSKLATPLSVCHEIERLKIDQFFPGWEQFEADITTLIRSHSSHNAVHGEGFNLNSTMNYGLTDGRRNAFVSLMRAADTIGLSKTLMERKHKKDFLSHLNTYLAETDIEQQYVFHTHQLVEQRGLLSNILHNATMTLMHESADWIPLLLYADGTAYLAPKGQPALDRKIIERQLGRRVHQTLKQRVQGQADSLLEQTAQGIKFKPDALTSGLPFSKFYDAIWDLVQRRKFKLPDLEAKARERLQKLLVEKTPQDVELVQQLTALLADPTPFITGSETQMKGAELARTYYILLTKYSDSFRGIGNVWQHIYNLLGLPSERYPFYDAFDALYDRPYVLAGDLLLTEEQVVDRLIEDGALRWPASIQTGDSDEQASLEDGSLWQNYVSRYVSLDGEILGGREWSSYLEHYITHQHKQCVHCSAPFETEKWRAADVRDDIGVQKFSNRLRGGGAAEPVKHICQVCRIQFLLETLEYEPVKGEQTFYLHFYPRSYHTPPYIAGLQAMFQRYGQSDVASQALNTRVDKALEVEASDSYTVRPQFVSQTKEGKPMPYGIYIPKYPDSLGNVLITPINAPGDSETERYLFAVWHGLVLGMYWKVKTVLSRDPVPPLEAAGLPDLFLDLVPMGCTGLLPRHDRSTSTRTNDETETPLPANGFNTEDVKHLWDQGYHLFALRSAVFPVGDEMVGLVRSMSYGPLEVFYFIDRLLEKSKDVLKPRAVFIHVEFLALSIGGSWMVKLSEALKSLTAFAWQNRIIGTSLKRNSLLKPLDEILTHMTAAQGNREWDEDALIAATAQDIFDHLDRISEGGRGAKARNACTQFVYGWYTDILNGVYQGNQQKLLSDAKQLRSAYLFYLQSQIPQRTPTTQTEETQS